MSRRYYTSLKPCCAVFITDKINERPFSLAKQTGMPVTISPGEIRKISACFDAGSRTSVDCDG